MKNSKLSNEELDKLLIKKAMDIFKSAKETNSGCLLSSGWHNGLGYAKVQVRNKKEYVHRIICREINKQKIEKMVVMHSCDNPRCINPNHLSTGTQLQNVRDCITKNRNYKKVVTKCKQGHNLKTIKYPQRIARFVWRSKKQ